MHACVRLGNPMLIGKQFNKSGRERERERERGGVGVGGGGGAGQPERHST